MPSRGPAQVHGGDRRPCHTPTGCLVMDWNVPEGNRSMNAKINVFAAAPALMRDFRHASTELAAAANFDPKLTELVKLRASQLNGCANCINLHATEARET